jgi:hypothetical protein
MTGKPVNIRDQVVPYFGAVNSSAHVSSPLRVFKERRYFHFRGRGGVGKGGIVALIDNFLLEEGRLLIVEDLVLMPQSLDP